MAVVSKEPLLEECNTQYAQGGIVARGEGDSPALLAKDITVAGDGINSREAVELLAAEGPAARRRAAGAPAGRAVQPRSLGEAGPHAGGGAFPAADLFLQGHHRPGDRDLAAGGRRRSPADQDIPVSRGHRPDHEHAQLHRRAGALPPDARDRRLPLGPRRRAGEGLLRAGPPCSPREAWAICSSTPPIPRARPGTAWPWRAGSARRS